MLKNFRLKVISRVIILTLTLAFGIYLWFNTAFYVSFGVLVIFIFYQIIQLIHYVELTNRKLSRFLNSIRYSDFSRSFASKNLGASYQQLDESFEQVVEAFKKQRLEKQVQFRYMQTVVRHIGIGLISFKQNGDVELINAAAKRLFQIATLRHIKDLSALNPMLVDTIEHLESDKRRVAQIAINNKSLQLAVHATVFRLRDEIYKLVSFQDINTELEEKEMEAWQNLTQVMAHEIMNSVTPIASLSDTVQMLIETNIRKENDHFIIHKETVKDVTEALETIENRSRGLIRFVNSYRDFTKIPQPDVSLFSVKKLLQRIQNLNSGEAKLRCITITASVEPDTLELTADPHLIEQVLINLIKNAFRALQHKESGTIELIGEISRGTVYIHVRDDGPGISTENIDKIFIPFYSTQRRDEEGGSGIGLSLSRQIMRAHGGSLSVKSDSKQGTTFTLQF